MCQSIDIDIVLTVAFEFLEKDAQRAIATRERNVTANASLVLLLEAFGKSFLNKEQQQKIQTIIALHDQCIYPRTYAPGMKEASRSLSIVQ